MSINYKNNTIFDNLSTIILEQEMETWQMIQFFIYFSFYSKIVQIRIHKVLLWPILVWKYLNFGQQLPIGTAHHTFLKCRHSEDTKNPNCYTLPSGAKKSISSWTTSIYIFILKVSPFQFDVAIMLQYFYYAKTLQWLAQGINGLVST